MATVLYQSSRVGTTQAPATTLYYSSGSSTTMQGNVTEANRQPIRRTPGSASKMYIGVLANDLITPSTLRFRKNSADGSQVVSVPAATSGRFQDAANFDTILDGDLAGYQIITGAAGTTFRFSNIIHIFNSSINTSQRLVAQIGNAISVDEPYPLTSADSGSFAGNDTRIYGNGGTFKNMAIFVPTNTRDGTLVVNLRNAGGLLTPTVTIPASTTGLFEDLVNSYTAVATDLIKWSADISGASGSVTIATISIDFETTDRTFLLSNFGTLVAAAATPVFYKTLSGGNALNSTVEADAESLGLTQFTLTNFRTFTASNGITAASTMRVRKNSANGNLVISITASTSGEFEDIVNSDSVIPTDLMDVQVTVGATGTNITFRNHNLTATVAAVDDQYLPILGIGR